MRRQRRFYNDRIVANGMEKRQTSRVQRDDSIAFQFGCGAKLSSRPIILVSPERMASKGRLQPDLMHPSGFEHKFHKGTSIELPQHAVAQDSFFRPFFFGLRLD